MTTQLALAPSQRFVGFVHAQEIQVSGLCCFTGQYWKNAIRHFLSGLAGDKQEVTYRPKLHFGNVDYPMLNVILRLDPTTGTWYAYGINSDKHPAIPGDQMLRADGRQGTTEWALNRFVSDDSIKALLVELPYDAELDLWDNATVCLWKNPKTRHLEVSALGVPTLDELSRRFKDRSGS